MKLWRQQGKGKIDYIIIGALLLSAAVTAYQFFG